MVGRLIPAGTGFAYHAERRRRRAKEALGETTATASEVEAALTEALSTEDR